MNMYIGISLGISLKGSIREQLNSVRTELRKFNGNPFALKNRETIAFFMFLMLCFLTINISCIIEGFTDSIGLNNTVMIIAVMTFSMVLSYIPVLLIVHIREKRLKRKENQLEQQLQEQQDQENQLEQQDLEPKDLEQQKTQLQLEEEEVEQQNQLKQNLIKQEDIENLLKQPLLEQDQTRRKEEQFSINY